MTSRKSLAEYHRKRDFSKTPEPQGGRGGGPRGSRYVVQLHDASTRHFDFRMEVDGVLKSWAIPKGPSTDPHDKRLAVPTEDHPLDYQDFEGVIGDDQYGAGTVLVWDSGTYRNLSERDGEEIPIAEALARGHASFWLDGRKLHGGFALTRIRPEAWLLVKRDDGHASSAGTPEPGRAKSVRTRRTLKQIAADAEAARKDRQRADDAHRHGTRS
ncbi:DNA polymerase ligase N-terminal domain-containing protein [Streptantibioticus ferralitis]|uniref:DNA polymerase ligase N-terminal domain-containing protein n=1 Tax=Streptantibioticus ferralitis TaxID=236510 RepID=A0ABT5YX33_9ACTN|nr:DNA polymerase ligase N-terminal domain-containing protein [Streptantibioticus ferralitis]MDF2256163.1 DNA polymerase ligase N-terminal domain-containing protein [Streptantibioticus ferralitis]